MTKAIATALLFCLPLAHAAAQSTPAHFGGIDPHLAVLSTSYSECGIGAVVPWADRLWLVSYVAHKSGAGVGLFEVDRDLTIRRRPESIVGTHAGRMIHRPSGRLVIGPYLIDNKGKVRVFKDLARSERVTAVAVHLTDPAHKVYMLAMEGNLYEADVYTLRTRKLFDLRKELGIRGPCHFKGAYTAQGRLVVANNSYDAGDARPGSGRRRATGDGRLAEWDGRRWTVVRRTAFCEVTTAAGVDAVPSDEGPLYATGWDKRSVLLAALTDGRWTSYRLPKGSSAYDHAWCTEWPRIRRVEPGSLLMDMHGLFYKMSPDFAPGRTGGLAPLAYHLRVTPDFCVWRGKLVLAGDQNSSMNHRNRTGGQPQSNLYFGSLDELGKWGRPAGWGGPWLEDPISAGTASEPFLIGGFTRRSLHLVLSPTGQSPAGAAAARPVFTLEIDADGAGRWTEYKKIEMPAGGYAFEILPDELPGRWMRITSDRDTSGSAMFLFGPRTRAAAERPSALFSSFSKVTEKTPRTGGGLLPFAGRLWFTSYRTDADGRPSGAGLYEIDGDMKFMRRAESLDGVFTNRKMVGGLLSIGPHLIAASGQVRTIQTLRGEHLVDSIRYPSDPGRVCFLTIDGRLLAADLRTLRVEPLADIPRELRLDRARLRFTAGHQAGKSIFVTAAALDGRSGCLARWDGKDWSVIDRSAYGRVCDWASISGAVVATGWDRASAFLKIRSGEGRWATYRLPKADPAYDTAGPSAGSAIREVQTERILMDVCGIFYETTGLAHAWFVRPVATHGRIVSDFCSWRGMTVLAGADADAATGDPRVLGTRGVGLWFGKTDDLWQLGRPRGRGGPWLETPVKSDEPSDPYLMTNFETKRVELCHDAGAPVTFTILVDPLGTRRAWKVYKRIPVAPGEKATYKFPDGYSAHWVRMSVDRDCTATAQFVYE